MERWYISRSITLYIYGSIYRYVAETLHICTYIYIRTCIHNIYVYMSVKTFTYTYIHICVCIHICVYLHVCVYIHAHVPISDIYTHHSATSISSFIW